jgi:hypothetical protein
VGRRRSAAATGEGVGWVGYWKREWHPDQIYEIGCNSQLDLFSSGEG